jgi:hypothetical protein
VDKSEPAETLALLEDLSIRLRKLGVTVKLDYREKINLVASYSNKAISLEPDWNLSGQDLVQNLVYRPALLSAHGWLVERAYALQLFIDPEKYAKQLAQKLGIQVYDKVQSMFDDQLAFEDTDQAWGDRPALGNDQRLEQDKPPHWQ